MLLTNQEFYYFICALIFLIIGIVIGYFSFGKEFKFLGYFVKDSESVYIKVEDPIEPVLVNNRWEWGKAIYTGDYTLEKDYYARPDQKKK